MTSGATGTEPELVLYVRPGDPDCEEVRAFLDIRGLAYTVRDVTSDPGASAVLFGRLGRVAVPALQRGARFHVGRDPISLSRFLPSDEPQERVAFGAAVRSVSPEVAQRSRLPATYGVEVGRVNPGSPAEAAGIQPGDLIVGIGPYTLHGGAEQFGTAVAARRPGDTMQLRVWRDGDELPVVVSFPKVAEGSAAG